jgi:hypothetical protein
MKGWRVKGLGSKDWVEGLNMMVKGSGLWFTSLRSQVWGFECRV